jgi:hypothetical protein
MMAKEKHLAAVGRLEEPPLCDCRDRAMINLENTLDFVCPNKHGVSGNVYLFKCLALCVYVLIYSLLALWICEVSFQGVALWS